MAEDVPDYYHTVSIQLSRAMDDIGMNKTTVKYKRNACLIQEEMESLSTLDLSYIKDSAVHIYGSQTEGTTTRDLNSDIDTLFCLRRFNAIQDWSEWVHGKLNLLLLQEDTAPGHRRLQVLSPNVPLPRDDLPNDNFVYDGLGRVLLKNTIIQVGVGQVNGPAISETGRYRVIDNDFIYAAKCASWPREADDWKRRYKTHPTDWITLDIIQKTEEKGFFLVPVGYKLSETPDLEWRVSLSYTERLLMFNMNITMLKCYVVLKMIVKTFITPQTGKTITSYHCKTALFHCIELTRKQTWQENNLLYCIDICLHKLQTFLMNDKCPHFIMPEINLFDGKITPNNKIRLVEILNALTESRGRFIFAIHLDRLGSLFLSRLSYPKIRKTDMQQSAHIIITSTGDILTSFYMSLRNVLFKLQDKEYRSVLVLLHQHIQLISDEMRLSTTYKRRAIKLIIAYLSPWIGSIMSSVCLSLNRPIPNVALQWFEAGITYSKTPFLKLASVFYMSGDFLKSVLLLRNVEDNFEQNVLCGVCACSAHLEYVSQRQFENVFNAHTLKKRLNFFVPCVQFMQNDMYCAPPALRNEIHRSMGDDKCHRDPAQDWWMDLAVVDNLPFLYYLQYLTYGKLDKRELQKQALKKLEACLKEKHSFGHLETGWNLLGQCMEQERNVNAAMFCYQTSLEIRPRDNTAHWHIQNLRCRNIRGEI